MGTFKLYKLMRGNAGNGSILFLMLLWQLCAQPVRAQVINTDTLDANDISAVIGSGGFMLPFDITGSYIVPKNSNPPTSTIFTGALWIGGIDNYGQLRIAAETYRQNGNDFYPGPLNGEGTAADTIDYNYVWSVTAGAIDTFNNTFAQSNGTVAQGQVPASIWGWPGRGNTHAVGGMGGFTVDTTEQKAPFFDRNNNGIYDPEHGDYPLIKGDQALWWVYNDDAAAHTETGGMPLYFEVQAMAYAHMSGDPAIDNTVYLLFNIANHSDRTYDSLYTGAWIDMDIGCYTNDYMGSDSSYNYFYGYNGTVTDSSCGANGYGDCPPAQTVQFLNSPMSGFVMYNNDFTLYGNPTTAGDYYNYLKSRWKDGSRFIPTCYDSVGPLPTNYMYPSNPGVALSEPYPQSWSEVSCGDPPGDRRGMGATGPIQLGPGQSYNVDLALTTFLCVGGDTNFNENKILPGIVDVKQAYGQDIMGVAGVKPAAAPGIVVYPSPNNGNFTITITGNNESGASITIYDMLGRQVYNTLQATGTINIQLQESGMYMIRYSSGENSVVKKVVVE